MKERDLYVDVAKGICILLVICIHTEVFGVIGMPLTFIAVPMFFFLSGFYDRSERSVKTWLPKAIKTLIVPGIIWLAIGLIYVSTLSYLNRGIISFSNTIYEPFAGNGPVWFLFALFYTKLLTWCICRLHLKAYIALIFVILGGYFINYQLPLCLDEGLAALPLYYMGKVSYPYMTQLRKNILLNITGTICLILFVSGMLSFTIVPIGNGFYKPLYPIPLFTIMLVFVPVLNLCKVIGKCTWFAKAGRHSLGIMLIHSMMCHTAAVILNRFFEKGSTIWICAFFIAYIIICFAAYYFTITIERYCPVLFGKENENS